MVLWLLAVVGLLPGGVGGGCVLWWGWSVRQSGSTAVLPISQEVLPNPLVGIEISLLGHSCLQLEHNFFSSVQLCSLDARQTDSVFAADSSGGRGAAGRGGRIPTDLSISPRMGIKNEKPCALCCRYDEPLLNIYLQTVYR